MKILNLFRAIAILIVVVCAYRDATYWLVYMATAMNSWP